MTRRITSGAAANGAACCGEARRGSGLRSPLMRAAVLAIGGIGLGCGFGIVGPAAAQDGVSLTKSTCRKAVRYIPATGAAGADYVPGVDARGRAVAPADVGGGNQFRLPDSYTINLEIDLFEQFGIPLDPRLAGSDLSVGQIEIRGRDVYFNGQALQDDAERAFVLLCRERFPDLK